MTAPRRARPTPKTLAQGFGTLFVYVGIKKSKRPIRWSSRHVRRAIRGWSGYLAFLREQSIVEGVFGGRKAWLVIGAGLWGSRALRRATRGTERIVLNEVLQPGDRIVITQLPKKPTRKARRAAARAG